MKRNNLQNNVPRRARAATTIIYFFNELLKSNSELSLYIYIYIE